MKTWVRPLCGFTFTICLLVGAGFKPVPTSAGYAGEITEVLRSDSKGMTLEVRSPKLSVEKKTIDGRVYTVLGLENGGFTAEEGRPRIPTLSLLIGTPAGAEVSAQALGFDRKVLSVGLVYPNPITHAELTEEGYPSVQQEFRVDRSFYSSPKLYPQNLLAISPLGAVRGHHIARLEIHPFQYNPTTGELLSYSRMRIQVTFQYPSPSRAPHPRRDAFESILSKQLLNYDEAKGFYRPRRESPLSAKPIEGEIRRYKILIKEDGVYRIDSEQLEEADVDLEGIDPRTIRITNRGVEIPILVGGEKDGLFDRGDAIEFYGEYNRNALSEEHKDIYKDPYTDTNVYWLSWGGDRRGLRLADESGAIRETDPLSYNQPFSYEFLVHAEVDGHRDRLGRVREESDHWFWDRGVEGRRTRSYEVLLPDPDRGSPVPPTVRVMMRGKTFPSGSPDHHALIYFNGTLVADEIWDDQLLLEASSQGFSDLSSSNLTDGVNRLDISLPGELLKSAGASDAVYLNWFEVEYPRLYWADEDYIEFHRPKEGPDGLYQFVIGGFSKPKVDVYKRGISRITNAIVQFVGGEEQEGTPREKGYYQVTFQDEIFQDGVEYVALTPERKKSPFEIEEDEPSNLRSEANGADYIMITHEDFYEIALKLADFRRSQGLKVETVKVQDIYDEFNYGILSPEAIRDFLKYAYENWEQAPTYVLLVGDGTWDYKGVYGRGGNFIPPFLTHTEKWGSTASDHMYSCVSGDDLLPDLFIGRLPVSTTAGLLAVIDKIIDYERSPELGRWRGNLLFIGGSGTDFRDQSESLITSYVPPGFDVSRIYLHSEYNPYFGGTQDLIDRIDDGVLMTNFLGHGGGAIWSDASLMRLGDISLLNNGKRLTFVASFTCFTGAFDEPFRSSLGEEFLKAEGKGAIALLGSSGLGWLLNDFLFNQSLLASLFDGEGTTIGEVLTEAKIDYFSKHSGPVAEAMIKSYNLLGDPATRLGIPRDGLDLSIIDGRSVSPGDSIALMGDVGLSLDGRAELELSDSSGRILQRTMVPVADGKFSAGLRIPDSTLKGEGRVSAYVSDGKTRDWIKTVELSIGGSLISDVRVDPPSPVASDSVRVRARIDDPDGVETVAIHFTSRVDTGIVPMGKESPPPGEEEFVAALPLTDLAPGEEVKFNISVADKAGNLSTSRTFSFKVALGARLVVRDIFLTGKESVEIAANIENRGDVTSDSVVVEFFLGDPKEGGYKVGERFISGLPPEALEATVVSVPFTPEASGEQVVSIRIGGMRDEVIRSVRIPVDKFNVTWEEGTGGEVRGSDGNLAVSIPGGTVGSDCVLKIGSPEPVEIRDQPDFRAAPLPGFPDGASYRIVLADLPQEMRMGKNLSLTFNFDPSDTLTVGEKENLVISRWGEGIGKWVSLGGAVDSTSISAETDRFGLFALMIDHDVIPPTIDIAVFDGAFVSSRPKISAVIQDANGVNLEGIKVRLDGSAVDSSLIRFPDKIVDANSVPLNFYPHLEEGEHTISFRALDTSGNWSEEETVSLKVTSSFNIIGLGNYPNPFSDYTIFTYTLPSPAREVSFKIYSVSGRLVKVFEDFEDLFGNPGTSTGYHELKWDGLNDDGEELARGVYFCQVRAVPENGEPVEKRMKLARVPVIGR